MELTLKVTLSDEQYNALMEKASDTVLTDEQFIDALKQKMQENVSDWVIEHFKDNAREFISRIYRLSYWGDSDNNYEKLIKDLVRESMEKEREKITAGIAEGMKKMVSDKNVDISKIVTAYIMDAIMHGTTKGLDNWMMAVHEQANIISRNFSNLRGYLNLGQDAVEDTNLVPPPTAL